MWPGWNSSLTNLYGPEPTVSVICWYGSVLASRSGMMKGGPAIFESASSSSGKGSFNRIVKLLSPTASILSTAVASDWPKTSRTIHRRNDATQSTPPTGMPS